MAISPAINQKALNTALRRLAADIIDGEADSEGNITPITRADKLAALLWDLALGVSRERDSSGTLQVQQGKPAAWAMQYVFERLEGRSMVAAPETAGGIRAADKVRELSKQRINALAKASVGHKLPPPPPHKPKV